MSMVQIIPCRTRVLQTIYQWQEPITIPVSQCCPASLLELRPRHPSRGKSAFRSILYLVKAASPWNLNVGGLAIHYLMQIMKLLLNLFHCIVSLLDLLQCVQHLQKREILARQSSFVSIQAATLAVALAKRNSTLPRPCSWIALWKICSPLPVSISLSIVWNFDSVLETRHVRIP